MGFLGMSYASICSQLPYDYEPPVLARQLREYHV